MNQGRQGGRTPPGPPGVRTHEVARQALVDVLSSASDAAVVTLAAPGGYGKTTLLQQWGERWRSERGGNLVWLDIAPGSDSREIAGRLARALVAIGRVTESDALPVAQDDPTWHAVTLPALESLVRTQSRPLLVVLDDAMNLEDPLVHGLLETIVSGLNAESQLAIATRDQTPLAARRLRASGRSFELGPLDLAMDHDEASQLLESQGVTIADEKVAEVVAQTEGWPVGLYLLGQALLKEPDHLQVAVPSGLSPGWIADYLRDELYQPLDRDTAAFLDQVSVVDELCGPVCDAVADRSGSLQLLRTLAAQNRLILRVDRPDECYRLHHLFAEFLRSELYARSIAEYQGSQGRAWEWFASQGADDIAVKHAREMGDDEAFGVFVWERAWRLLTVGRAPVARTWLAGVSETRIAASVGLTLTDFYVHLHEGDVDTTARRATQIRSFAADQSLSDLERAHCAVAEALLGEGGIASIVDLTTEALEGLTRHADPWGSVALYLRGVALVHLGDVEAALDDLQQGVTLCRRWDVSDVLAHCLATQAGIHLSLGRREVALELLEQARAIVFTHQLENNPLVAPIFTISAAVLLANGAGAEASDDAMRALRLTSLMSSVAPWHAAAGRLTLAQVYSGLGDHERARVLTQEARERYTPAARSPLTDTMLKQSEELVESLGDPPVGPSLLTTAELRVLQYLPSHLSFPEIGQQLWLSRHTVKSQAMSAYRKLGVSSRSEAVTRARQLGLLPPR